MLWLKAWLDTRSRFLAGLGLLTCVVAVVVFTYPRVLQLMPLVADIDTSTEIGRRIKASADLAREYRGYVWSQGFAQNIVQAWTLFAVLLGSGSVLSRGTGGAALFTLSLPVTRGQLLGVRAATGILELLALALVPAVLLPLLSPAVGQAYAVGDGLVHGLCLFVAGTVFFSLAFLLSTEFSDVWRPLLVALFLAMALASAEQLDRRLAPYGVFAVMSGETYFRTGGVPWLGLLTSGAASGGMFALAAWNFARRDF